MPAPQLPPGILWAAVVFLANRCYSPGSSNYPASLDFAYTDHPKSYHEACVANCSAKEDGARRACHDDTCGLDARACTAIALAEFVRDHAAEFQRIVGGRRYFSEILGAAPSSSSSLPPPQRRLLGHAHFGSIVGSSDCCNASYVRRYLTPASSSADVASAAAVLQRCGFVLLPGIVPPSIANAIFDDAVEALADPRYLAENYMGPVMALKVNAEPTAAYPQIDIEQQLRDFLSSGEWRDNKLTHNNNNSSDRRRRRSSSGGDDATAPARSSSSSRGSDHAASGIDPTDLQSGIPIPRPLQNLRAGRFQLALPNRSSTFRMLCASGLCACIREETPY